MQLIKWNVETSAKFVRLLKETSGQSALPLETDKTGSFAVLPAGPFVEKKSGALNKLFWPFTGNVKAFKGKICPILERADASRILKDVTGRSSSTSSCKFFLKDHKPSLPQRTVVNEIGTWQGLLSSFLQKCLNYVCLSGSLSVRNSD